MIYQIIIYTTLFIIIDYILTFYNLKGQYYFNHFLVNMTVSILCFDDLILTYTDFNNINNHVIDYNSVSLVFAIHFYHIIIYYKKFVYDDWLHHIVMIFFTLPLALQYNCGSIMGHSIFFVTGLPGGINYFLLFLNRNNLIEKKNQKYINYHLNLWIRNPGCTASAVIMLLYALINYESFYMIIISFLIIFTNYWNGIYFMEQVVRNYNINYLK